MDTLGNFWVLLLAAGDGTRVREMTRSTEGETVPKQFHRFGTAKTLLQRALKRAERLVPRERILVVVSPKHEKWWRTELSDLPPKNVIVQPLNRGTSAGIYLPLLEIMSRDPDARILVLPSDHFVEQEEVLYRALLEALPLTLWKEDQIVLLGIHPEKPDTQYGWIVPTTLNRDKAYPVERFVEKPDLKRARSLWRQGALWNSFMFAAAGRTLLMLFAKLLPSLQELVEWKQAQHPEGMEAERLLACYENLPTSDFSRDLLESAKGHLQVFPVPPCGWSDLGTPERLSRFMAQYASGGSQPSSRERAVRAPLLETQSILNPKPSAADEETVLPAKEAG